MSAEERAAKQRELFILLERLAKREKLPDYIVRGSPHEPPPDHMAPFIDWFERARRYGGLKARGSIPPGHTKTTTATRALAWFLDTAPADTCAYASYSNQQAWSVSRQVRNLARRMGTQIAGDSAAVSEWRTVQDGGLFAFGVGGGQGKRITGLFVIDDAYPNRQAAESPAQRESEYEWFRDVALTRLTAGASMLVLGTRWHDEDNHGRIIAGQHGDDWEHFDLPALATDDDILGRDIGAALWDKYPREWLLAKCKDIGEWAFECIYQQAPRPKTGGMFKRDRARYCDAAPEGGRSVRGFDLAATGHNPLGPWTVGAKMKRVDDVIYVEHVERFQGEPDEVEAGVIELHEADDEEVLYDFPEDPGAGGKAWAKTFVAKCIGRMVEASPESGSKVLRAEPFASQWNARNVVMVRGDWNKPYLDELCKFPTGKLSDQVDASSRAFSRLIDMPDYEPPAPPQSVRLTHVHSRRHAR
jgi:predicted phage terminase large subunit-like protein